MWLIPRKFDQWRSPVYDLPAVYEQRERIHNEAVASFAERFPNAKKHFTSTTAIPGVKEIAPVAGS